MYTQKTSSNIRHMIVSTAATLFSVAGTHALLAAEPATPKVETERPVQWQVTPQKIPPQKPAVPATQRSDTMKSAAVYDQTTGVLRNSNVLLTTVPTVAALPKARENEQKPTAAEDCVEGAKIAAEVSIGIAILGCTFDALGGAHHRRNFMRWHRCCRKGRYGSQCCGLRYGGRYPKSPNGRIRRCSYAGTFALRQSCI